METEKMPLYSLLGANINYSALKTSKRDSNA